MPTKGRVLEIRVETLPQRATDWAVLKRDVLKASMSKATVRVFKRTVGVDGLSIPIWVVVVREATE